MSDILSDALKQTPSLVVLVCVVALFLKHLRDRDKIMMDTIKEMNVVQLEARHDSRDVIAHNTEVLEKNIERNGELMQLVKTLQSRLT